MMKISFFLLVLASCSTVKQQPQPNHSTSNQKKNSPTSLCQEKKFLKSLYTCTPTEKMADCQRKTLVPQDYLYLDGSGPCGEMEDKKMLDLCLTQARVKNDSILNALQNYYPFADFEKIVRSMILEKRPITEPAELERSLRADQNKFIQNRLASFGREPAQCASEITKKMKEYQAPKKCSLNESCSKNQLCIESVVQTQGFCAKVFKPILNTGTNL